MHQGRRQRLHGQTARRREVAFPGQGLDAEMKRTMLSEAEEPQALALETKLLIEAIYERYHYDFRGYSPISIARQLNRAKERFGCRTLSMLQHRVLHEPAIMPELLNLLTIQVSDLFRDPSYFRALREHVIPHLVTYPSLKVWIAGCGDGEELYSL